MNDLRLRFRNTPRPDLALETGMVALGLHPDGLAPVDADAPWLLQLCHDRRGTWMTVADHQRGVHLNGRPVRQLAMLRAGDSIHVDEHELLLLAANDDRGPVPPAAPRDVAGNLRLVLRGVGGPHHGRSFSLEKPRRVGSAANADLRIDGHGIAAEHAWVEAVGGQAVLRSTASEVLLNGQPVREAVLRNGDQLTFGVHHRFVLEGPPPAASAMPAHGGRAPAESEATVPTAARHWTRRIPWLLVSALLLAGALAALLVFGAR